MIALAGAKGFAAAIVGAYATVFIVIVSLAVMAPAITATLLVPLFARWPALQRTSGRTAVTAIVACVVTAIAIWAIALVIANTLLPLNDLSPLMPFVAALTVGAAFGFQLYHRQTFTRTRAIGIASAALVPVVFFAALMV
jgi:uncharacterized membrane-anchored protein